MYYSDENGKIIDTIRQKIEEWKIERLINEKEYFVLLACLIETVPFYANISGVYAAFQKKWDARAVKKMVLRPVEFIVNNKENFVFNKNSVELLNEVEADIFILTHHTTNDNTHPITTCWKPLRNMIIPK